MKNVLFVSVDGVQNYLESLFFPVLAEIDTSDISFEVLEFCPQDLTLKNNLLASSEKYKIPLHLGRYFNFPPVLGSFIFVLYGTFRTLYIVKKRNIDILMPRSLLAGAMVLLIKLFCKRRIEIVYESDGLMSDERVDFGSWKKTGLIYRLFQYIERKLVQCSERVIVRTQLAKEILLQRSPMINHEKIIVIPNGKDSHAFKPIAGDKRQKIRAKYGIAVNDMLMVYVGSIGEQYQPLTMLCIFETLSKAFLNFKFLILTPNKAEMQKIIENSNVDSEHIIIDQVPSEKIADYIAASDLGLALRVPSFSQKGVCPLKIIEYLLCGIPVITNAGIGDFDEIFKKGIQGYIIQDLTKINYEDIEEFVYSIMSNHTSLSRKNRDLGLEYFDLEKIGKTYDELFQSMIERL